MAVPNITIHNLLSKDFVDMICRAYEIEENDITMINGKIIVIKDCDPPFYISDFRIN